MVSMASFVVRLDETELAALRAAAEAQGRSMNDLVRDAVRAVISAKTREDEVRALTERVLVEDAELLRRLGET